MGMHQLMAEGSDWDESRSASRAVSRIASRAVSPTGEREHKDNTVQVSPSFAYLNNTTNPSYLVLQDS